MVAMKVPMASLALQRIPVRASIWLTYRYKANRKTLSTWWQMYDKNDWSLRLAYNWRSKYLLTTRDVISKYPLWNDASGFLDGSAFYNINEQRDCRFAIDQHRQYPNQNHHDPRW